MFSNLFKTKPVIDESSKEWIYDSFSWCMQQLDGEFFKDQSELVLPNNHFYPGSSTSVDEMASNIFTNTCQYTGMSQWPIKLVNADTFIAKTMPQLSFSNRLRGDNAQITFGSEISFKLEGQQVNQVPAIEIAFHQSQLNQPQDLIAYLVQHQAGILVAQQASGLAASGLSTSGHETVTASAPGGKEVMAQTIDLVACFMGFGVIFANTAYQFKGGCGSCNNRSLNRQAALPELETVYALALFCVIKGLEVKQVKKELKSHLYKPFRQAHQEISQYLQQTTNPNHALLISK